MFKLNFKWEKYMCWNLFPGELKNWIKKIKKLGVFESVNFGKWLGHKTEALSTEWAPYNRDAEELPCPPPPPACENAVKRSLMEKQIDCYQILCFYMHIACIDFLYTITKTTKIVCIHKQPQVRYRNKRAPTQHSQNNNFKDCYNSISTQNRTYPQIMLFINIVSF